VNIAFATSDAHRDLTPDDHLAVVELQARGAAVTGAVWNDPSVDWTAFDSIIIRSTWDYHRHADEFRTWIGALEATGAPMWNPPAVLHWNMEKTYLRDLERAGVPVVPTEWLARGSRPDLAGLLASRGWLEAVVKPVISAAATRTWRVSRDTVSEIEAALAESLEIGDVMVQPFIPEIQTKGEWSLMFIEGEFSHAVRKMPTAGDFRVQTGFGGRSAADNPDSSVLSAARLVLDAVPSPWLYARVDGIETESGFVLLELEMLEPALFFSHTASGAARFADSIIRLASLAHAQSQS
jgi:glutathione synthase/RimK-type ligase-like ATP-grasp enzyme